jgi:hypothetical protein
MLFNIWLFNRDNYGFVTFAYKVDAYEAVEHGNDDPNLPKYDLSFGGRRAFCKEQYADLGERSISLSCEWWKAHVSIHRFRENRCSGWRPRTESQRRWFRDLVEGRPSSIASSSLLLTMVAMPNINATDTACNWWAFDLSKKGRTSSRW